MFACVSGLLNLFKSSEHIAINKVLLPLGKPGNNPLKRKSYPFNFFLHV